MARASAIADCEIGPAFGADRMIAAVVTVNGTRARQNKLRNRVVKDTLNGCKVINVLLFCRHSALQWR